MSHMFENCTGLRKLNINNFRTNNVVNMNSMFRKCSSLKEINLDNFDTNKISNMCSIFAECNDELKNKIKEKYKNFSKDCFD